KKPSSTAAPDANAPNRVLARTATAAPQPVRGGFLHALHKRKHRLRVQFDTLGLICDGPPRPLCDGKEAQLVLGFDFDVTGTEAVRQTGQIFLEKLQPDYHTDRGATPFPIASDITDLALRYHPGSDISFLEPCIGTGIFFSASLHDAADHAGQLRIQSAHGVEHDEQFAALAHDLWAPAGLAINNLDFLCLTEAHLPKA